MAMDLEGGWACRGGLGSTHGLRKSLNGGCRQHNRCLENGVGPWRSAWERKKGYETYWHEIQESISHNFSPQKVIQQIKFISDDETELFFKAADVTVLPYTEIFQSGILFLAYSFGLPVIATDVGSFRQDVVEGRTGFICKPKAAEHLAAVLETYFESDLFKHLADIRDHVNRQNSWQSVANITSHVYALLGAK